MMIRSENKVTNSFLTKSFFSVFWLSFFNRSSRPTDNCYASVFFGYIIHCSLKTDEGNRTDFNNRKNFFPGLPIDGLKCYEEGAVKK